MTNVRAVGPLHLPHRPQSWASDLLAVLLVSTILAGGWHAKRAYADAMEQATIAAIERDVAYRERDRAIEDLAQLRQRLNGCLNGDGMTTVGEIGGVHFALACKPVRGL